MLTGVRITPLSTLRLLAIIEGTLLQTFSHPLDRDKSNGRQTTMNDGYSPRCSDTLQH